MGITNLNKSKSKSWRVLPKICKWQKFVLWPFLANFRPLSFTKLRFRPSFWRAEQVQILIASKIMTQKANTSIFFQFCKKILICVVFFAIFAFFACFSLSQLLNQLRFTPVQHLKMTIWISVLWMKHVVDQTRPDMV